MGRTQLRGRMYRTDIQWGRIIQTGAQLYIKPQLTELNYHKKHFFGNFFWVLTEQT